MGKILNYKVYLEVMGPVHIGSGKKLEKSEYIFNKNRVYVLEPVKMFNYLKEANLLNEYQREIMGGSNMTDFIKNKGIPVSEYKNLADYSYNAGGRIERKTQISTCIKDAYNMPYIPGSSLKGAIRNAVLNAILTENEDKNLANAVERESKIKKVTRTKYLTRESEKADTIFRTYNYEDKSKKRSIENDIFKGLRVSDSKPLNTDDIILCQKRDVRSDGKENNLPIMGECIRPGTVVEFNVEINTDIFKYDGDFLTKCIKNFYKRQRECFLSKFKSTGNDNKTGSFLYVGGGSGFVSKTALYGLFHDSKKGLQVASVVLDNVDSVTRGKKTGDHLKDPARYGVSPHMRKCTLYNNELMDFGLCKINFQPIG